MNSLFSAKAMGLSQRSTFTLLSDLQDDGTYPTKRSFTLNLDAATPSSSKQPILFEGELNRNKINPSINMTWSAGAKNEFTIDVVAKGELSKFENVLSYMMYALSLHAVEIVKTN